jgi:hypothetical protein
MFESYSRLLRLHPLIVAPRSVIPPIDYSSLDVLDISPANRPPSPPSPDVSSHRHTCSSPSILTPYTPSRSYRPLPTPVDHRLPSPLPEVPPAHPAGVHGTPANGTPIPSPIRPLPTPPSFALQSSCSYDGGRSHKHHRGETVRDITAQHQLRNVRSAEDVRRPIPSAWHISLPVSQDDMASLARARSLADLRPIDVVLPQGSVRELCTEDMSGQTMLIIQAHHDVTAVDELPPSYDECLRQSPTQAMD